MIGFKLTERELFILVCHDKVNSKCNIDAVDFIFHSAGNPVEFSLR
jgi:hypothetical protein